MVAEAQGDAVELDVVEFEGPEELVAHLVAFQVVCVLLVVDCAEQQFRLLSFVLS